MKSYSKYCSDYKYLIENIWEQDFSVKAASIILPILRFCSLIKLVLSTYQFLHHSSFLYSLGWNFY